MEMRQLFQHATVHDLEEADTLLTHTENDKDEFSDQWKLLFPFTGEQLDDYVRLVGQEQTKQPPSKILSPRISMSDSIPQVMIPV